MNQTKENVKYQEQAVQQEKRQTAFQQETKERFSREIPMRKLTGSCVLQDRRSICNCLTWWICSALQMRRSSAK